MVHAAILGFLYVIPASIMERFSINGESRVVSIELRLPASRTATTTFSTPISAVSFSPSSDPTSRSSSILPLTLTGLVEASEIHARDVSIDRHALLNLKEHLLQRAPQPPEVTGPQELPVPLKYQLKRRQIEQDSPHATPDVSPSRPPRAASRLKNPPAVQTQPLEEIAGFENPTAADFSHNAPPKYPAEAVRQKLQGVVLLRLSISNIGRIKSVEVIQSSGHSILDEAGVDAVRLWKGKPATRWGRPVASTETLPIRFKL